MEPPLPPLEFAERPLSVQRVAAAKLLRIHRADRFPIHFGRERWHRFDDPLQQYGVLYASPELAVCFTETILRDYFRALPGSAGALIPAEELEDRWVSRLDTPDARPLRLADLRGPALQRLGGDAQVTASSDYQGLTQHWSRAIWEHPENVDGILYLSRYDNTLPATALFDRVTVRGLTVRETLPLLTHPDLPAVLDRYGVGI